MKKRYRKILIIVASTLGLLLLLTIWTYSSSTNDPVTTELKKIYPAALVGHGMISINDWEQNLVIAKRLEGDTTQAREQFIRTKQLEVLTQKLRLRISDQDFVDELNYIKTGQEKEYNQIL